MDTARIAQLLEPFVGPANDRAAPALTESTGLTAGDLQHISTYIDILLRWNARINLTAIRDPDEIVTRHFGESFFAACHLFPRHDREGHGVSPAEARPAEPGASAAGGSEATAAPSRGRAALQGRERDHKTRKALAPQTNHQRPLVASFEPSEPISDHPTVADLGSGAGFPGIPVKLWAPHIALTLIESNHKKATFLREIARALTLTDINIQNARAETLPPSSFDLVTLRAVERFHAILPIVAGLAKPTGRLAFLISATQVDQTRSLLPNRLWIEPIPVPASHSRVLLIGSPVAPRLSRAEPA